MTPRWLPYSLVHGEARRPQKRALLSQDQCQSRALDLKRDSAASDVYKSVLSSDRCKLGYTMMKGVGSIGHSSS